MEGVLTALIIFVLFPAVICGFILLSRYLKYRESLTMIEHGIMPPPPTVNTPYVPPQTRPYAVPSMTMPRADNNGAGRGTLIWGLVLSGIGLGLSLALYPIGYIAESASGGSVRFPLGFGPWMLAGFIPLFVGLALILGYVIMRPEQGSIPTSMTPLPQQDARETRQMPMPANAGSAMEDAAIVSPPNETVPPG